LRHWLERRAASPEARSERREQGVLLASGFVGGEGLLGVGIAAAAFIQGRKPEGLGTGWAGSEIFAMIAGLAAFIALWIWFSRMATRNA